MIEVRYVEIEDKEFCFTIDVISANEPCIVELPEELK